jgi:hypothetical protein
LFLSTFELTDKHILITGDLNIHCDRPTDAESKKFIELFHILDLNQYVNIYCHLSPSGEPSDFSNLQNCLQFLNLKPGKFRLFQSVVLMGALCMLLLNCGTAFQLSYAQLHLSTLLDANSKLIFLLKLILHSFSSHCLLFWCWLLLHLDLWLWFVIFMSSALEFHYLENKRYKSN